MENYLVIYDVRGIQKYIFKTDYIKEISGASVIVKDLLLNVLDEVIEKNYPENGSWKVIKDWDNATKFSFLEDEKVKIEYVYNGGGNLLIAFRGDEDELKNFNKELQVNIVKRSYSLSLACAYVELKENDSYLDARQNVKDKLSDVKKRMSEVVMQKSLPFVEQDPITGFPKSKVKQYLRENGIAYDEEFKTKKETVEAVIKELNAPEVENSLLDKMLLNSNSESNKNMLAVVHIDGNDMGAMISNYSDMLGKKTNDFSKDVQNSRYISKTINEVFNNKVKNLIEDKFGKYTRIVINSGDDITFICTANKAFEISREIMIEIENSSLTPENSNDATFEDNKFSSCGGICFIHPHFPFFRAYEIAEEVCSFAKAKAKMPENRIETRMIIKGEKYKRPSSYLDFYICDASILKSISEIREENKDLYLRPYLVNNNKEGYKDIEHLDNLLYLIKSFKSAEENPIARSSVKEIRNVYEKPKIYTKMLFRRLESRNAFKNFEGLDYNPYLENGVARYYDASTLLDLVDVKEGGAQ